VLPLTLFLALTYLLSWLPQLFGGGLFAFGPLIAALAVVALTGGRAGLGAWWTFVARWRGGIGWYALAIGLPFAINAAAAGLAILPGAATASADRFAPLPDLLVNFLVYLLAFGPLGEEPGWRGFALPRLLLSRSPLARTLALALVIVVWHLPLVAAGQQPAIVLVAVAASQILYTWLANRSGVPVLIVMLAHAAQGGLGGAYFGPLFAGADAALETSLLAVLYCAVALVIIWLAGPQLGQRADVRNLEAAASSAVSIS
jgi:membrane protease YdiL (CAAX protease family)